ncbi:MAG TPA: hypothetical protein VEK74_14190 [Burkholderiaceae bacterium]|nr:hypothetical protein [Burkholderiaceae bacterium]
MPGFFDEHRRRLQALVAELEALEHEAGLPDSIAASVEYVEAKDVRRRYFGVSDEDLRKALIAKYREVTEEHRQRYPASIADTKARIAEARKKAKKAPWGIPAAIAGLAVLLASYLWRLPGALAAVTIALFLGRWYVSRRRLHFAEELRLAQDELHTEEQGLREQLQDPMAAPVFSKAEEQSGREDP